jgi:predicted 3-demethylubiquinone-9 3-methyltransferase (glyoxalase superfamily)
MMQTITPFLWFDTQAEEAMNFYTSVFPNSKVISINRAQGRVMGVEFEVNGQRVMGLNGGPMYKFTEAFSLFVSCDTQAEIDNYWTTLTAEGGEPGRCGWLKDRFGLSWQIVPTVLPRLLSDPDPQRAGRVVQAMLEMNKLDIATLQGA